MRRGHILVVVLGLCFLVAGASRSDVPKTDTPPKTDDPKAKPPAGDLKLPTKKQVMAAKLKESQSILEGVALNDFDKVTAAADELMRVTRANDFLNAYKGDEYKFHMTTFRRAAEMVSKKARDKNMDGVMVAYNDLTLSCLKCHQAMRDKVFDARLPLHGDTFTAGK